MPAGGYVFVKLQSGNAFSLDKILTFGVSKTPKLGGWDLGTILFLGHTQACPNRFWGLA